MEKKRKKSKKKIDLKKKAFSHFRDDMEYYDVEKKQDSKNIHAIKKSKKIPKKRLINHLKGDVKGFQEEIKEDKKLIKKLKGAKNGSSSSYKKTKSKRTKNR